MTPRSDLTDPPLRPAVYHILLALAPADMHGLGIADAVERASDGALELGPGTLYRTLSELAGAALIRPVDPPEDDADPRRKYYGITASGRALLERETVRLATLVDVARSRMAGENA